MRLINLTEKEVKATLFALRGDLETVQADPTEFGDDAEAIQSAINKVSFGAGHTFERQAEPCPVCEMAVNVGLMSKEDKVMITTTSTGLFAGAIAVHGKCEDKFKKMKL